MKNKVEKLFKRLDDIQTYEEMSAGEFKDWAYSVASALSEAQEAGFENAGVQIRSTLEPYEIFPGNVEVTIWGFRDKDPEELKYEKERQEIQNLATTLGISFYEAETLKNIPKEKLKGYL